MPDKNIANTSLAKMKARLPKAIGTKSSDHRHIPGDSVAMRWPDQWMRTQACTHH